MKRQHEAFALDIARGIDETAAYLTYYPDAKPSAARVAASRLLKRPEIQEFIVTKKREITAQANELAVRELANNKIYLALDMAQRRHVLAEIAMGHKMPFIEKDGKETFRFPSEEDRIKAIKLDLELTGEGYRPPAPDNPGGPSIVQNNTVIKRITVFKTRMTTAPLQEIQQTPENDN